MNIILNIKKHKIAKTQDHLITNVNNRRNWQKGILKISFPLNLYF